MGLPLAQIGSRLEALFSELKGEENAYARAANVNVIVIASLATEVSLIEALSLVRPSRFFVVSIDESNKEVHVEVSAQCHGVGNDAASKHSVCSEIVNLRGSRSDLAKISGLIRANVISGMPVELFVSDPTIEFQLIRPIVDLAERIYFNGANVSFDILEKLLGLKTNLVDLEWIRLNVWREVIRTGYSHLLSSGPVGPVEQVSATSTNRVSSLLLSGWILSRLGLRVTALGGYGVECVGAEGDRVLLELKDGALAKMSLKFKDGLIDLLETEDTLCLKIESGLNTKGKMTHESKHSFKREGDVDLLKRYLLIGESTTNYREALKIAIDIESLDRRFRQ